MSRRYAMEASFLAQLLLDRRELLAAARTLGSASEMRAARDDLMASATINRTPTADHPIVLNVVDGVAHIPVTGELTPSADPCGALTGDAETEYGFIRSALAEAIARPDVESIALDVDSPGGYMGGLDETAQAIAAAPKPVTAYVSGMAASAAYWLASQADRIVALSPASRVGSIGLAMEEFDDREALAAEGIARRVYTSTDAPDKRPDTSTKEGQAKIVAELDALHAVFVRRVAEGRHVTEAKVSKDFGRGGVLTAEAAMAAGMVDEVLGSHIARPVSSAGPASSAAAAPAADISLKEVRYMDALTLEMLQAEHPEIVAAIEAVGIEKGIKAERKRREELLAFTGKSPAVDAAVQAAITSGASYAEAMPTIAAAAVQSLAGDNPPAIGAKAPEGGAGTGKGDPELLAMAAKAGITPETLAKFGPKDKE